MSKEFDESEHLVCENIKLKNGAKLHRFAFANQEYSGIYFDDFEVWNCVRKNEKQMIKAWNKSGITRNDYSELRKEADDVE